MKMMPKPVIKCGLGKLIHKECKTSKDRNMNQETNVVDGYYIKHTFRCDKSLNGHRWCNYCAMRQKTKNSCMCPCSQPAAWMTDVRNHEK